MASISKNRNGNRTIHNMGLFARLEHKHKSLPADQLRRYDVNYDACGQFYVRQYDYPDGRARFVGSSTGGLVDLNPRRQSCVLDAPSDEFAIKVARENAARYSHVSG